MLQHVGEDDEMSEMSSGLAASTVDSRHHEQDLAGFPEVERSRDSAVVAAVPGIGSDPPDFPFGLEHSPSKFAKLDLNGQVQGIVTSAQQPAEDEQAVSVSLV